MFFCYFYRYNNCFIDFWKFIEVIIILGYGYGKVKFLLLIYKKKLYIIEGW